MAGASRADLEASLAASLASHKFDREALREAASTYGTRATRQRVERAIAQAWSS
jgi:hypothetical protein